MDYNLPIGVFDSGIGGLTVFRQLRKLMPNENMIYFGDTKRNPYGSRPEAEIQQFIREILTFMTDNKVKLAVAACNTMTVLLDRLSQEEYPFRIIGMSKGARKALTLTRNRSIGVIATEATIRSGKHAAEITALDSKVKVLPKACPEFAPLVEAEQFEGEVIERAARKYLISLTKENVDVVILGCTHYPLLAPVIRKIMGPVQIFDPAEETALQVKDYLDKTGWLKPAGKGYSRLCFSSDVDLSRRISKRIIDVAQCRFEWTDLSKEISQQ